MPFRRILPHLLILVAVLAAAPSAAAPLSRSVRYGVSFAGLPVGRVHLDVTLDGDRYALKASGKVAGPASLVSNGSGTMAASGRLADRPAPERYAATILADGEEPDVVTIAFRDGNAVEVAVRPEEAEPPRDRVPLTGVRLAGIVDPLSAVLARYDAASGGRACPALLPIFDGRQRFDLSLAFERVESGAPIAADAILCRVRYEPVAGHRAGRRTIRDLRENRDMEILFARLAGSEVMAPVRIRVGTPLGALVFKADRLAAANTRPNGSKRHKIVNEAEQARRIRFRYASHIVAETRGASYIERERDANGGDGPIRRRFVRQAAP